MIAGFIIAAWLAVCAILLLANHAFKLSRKNEREALPDEHACQIGIGGSDFIVTHHGRASKP